MAKILNPTESKILRNFLIAKKVAYTIPKMLNLLDRINYPDTDPDLEQFGKVESDFISSLLRILNNELYLDLVLNLCRYLIEEYSGTEEIEEILARLEKPQGQTEDEEEKPSLWDMVTQASSNLEDERTKITETKRMERDAKLAEGWLHIDAAYLDSKRFAAKKYTSRISGFFKGAPPLWGHVLPPTDAEDDRESDVWQRKTVQAILKEIDAHKDDDLPYVLNLMDAQAEGKSTILKQVVAHLAQHQSEEINVLWRDESKRQMTIPYNLLERLKKHRQDIPWLIVCDEASLLGNEIHELATTAYFEEIKVHFLLSTSKVNWYAKDLDSLRWTDAKYNAVLVGTKQDGSLHEVDKKHDSSFYKLDKDDALGIVKKWSEYSKYDKDVMGDLFTYADDLDKAAEELMAKTTKGSGFQDGSLLGAMLEVRIGSDPTSYVEQLFTTLTSLPDVDDINLFDTFLYIIAMHALDEKDKDGNPKFEILDIDILTQALERDPTNSKDVDLVWGIVNGDLGREAAISNHGGNILSRHRVIATHAIKILREPNKWKRWSQIDQYYCNLAVAARRVLKDVYGGKFYNFQDIHYWDHDLPEYFKKRDLDTAIEIAYAMWNEEKTVVQLFTSLLTFLRDRDPKESLDTFVQHIDKVKKHRPLYSEGGTAAGQADERYLAIWLTGISLCDQIENESLVYKDKEENEGRYERIYRSLHNLMENYVHITEPESMFRACAATALIEQCFPVSEKLEKKMQEGLNHAKENGVNYQNWSFEDVIKYFKEGIIVAWQESTYKPKIIKGNELTFRELEGLPELKNLNHKRR